MSDFFRAGLLSAACLFAVACTEQTAELGAVSAEPVTRISAADYQRAEKMLRPNTDKLLLGRIVSQYWQDDETLVYQRTTESGSEFFLADPSAGTKTKLVDNARLSPLLEPHYKGENWDANSLALRNIELAQSHDILEFSFASKRFQLSLADYELTEMEASPQSEFLSPDGTKAVFVDSHNLWVRDTATNALSQLTFDGIEHYGYGTNNAGWLRDDGPVLEWSPDSKKIATFRHDSRSVGEMAVYNTQVGHVDIDVWKYPLPGDEHIFMIERLVIHLGEAPKIVALNMPPDAHRSTTSDHIAGRRGDFLDVQWSQDSDSLAFVSSSRDHKVATLKLANPYDGDVREVFEEVQQTYYEGGYSDEAWSVLHERSQFIWFSEKDNWAHLYLHDLDSGAEIRPLTTGNWRVLDLLKVDESAGKIVFTGSTPEQKDPYYQSVFSVNLDGSELTNLTPELAHHSLNWSKNGEYFVDYFSTPVDPGQSVIRDSSGTIVMELEKPNLTLLLEAGWVPPEMITVKARDQLTNIYGLLYKPSNFDESVQYPVLNYLYPGPQSGSVGSRSFISARGDKQALAELGFIVVEVDAMGTPGRTKEFHDAYYGNMGDNGLPDQIAAIRQLASQRSYMDLDRVGIWGHSGGGFASTAGILRYPDFYKVAVSGAGNHDNRNYEDDWGEKWQGLLEVLPESSPTAEGEVLAVTNYDNQANQLLADRLEGKLLLAHGMMDTNVHPSNTLLVVEALINAEKDFDLVVIPNAGHGFGNRRFFMKKRWDYFVEHLAKQVPPRFSFSKNIR
ncbi:MAG: DPP IV N-terminal domain-containing protein [Pseudohongiellaceae bacterium]